MSGDHRPGAIRLSLASGESLEVLDHHDGVDEVRLSPTERAIWVVRLRVLADEFERAGQEVIR